MSGKMDSSEIITEQYCNGCDKTVINIKKRYKGKKYCSTCYARIFKKQVCPSCHEYTRLPRNDEQAICNTCIKKQPCIRCNQIGKPIGKLTEYGVVCNSCSVHFRAIEPCERCNTPSKILTRISRFNDDLRVCPKCATRDYETCPSCHKYRLLELNQNGHKICKKCNEQPLKNCTVCEVQIAGGCGSLCDECYWNKNLLAKLDRNKKLFENEFLKDKFSEYVEWMKNTLGTHRAALNINKHTEFFVITEDLWHVLVPTYINLLQLLRANGLRKYELVMRWLNENHNIIAESDLKNVCSEIDQMDNLIESLVDSSNAYRVVNNYKNKMLSKVKSGKTSIRSARLAIKPAVGLMQYVISAQKNLPEVVDVKAYLTEFSGQAAALTGFINFLNEQYSTTIDYPTIKKSSFIQDVCKKKLEQELLKMLSLEQSIDAVSWVKKGLQFFHKMSYQETLKVKAEMVVEVEDGYNVLYKNQNYWLPKKLTF